MDHILFLVTNTFQHDSRLLRQAESLVESGCEVTVFALHAAGLPFKESRGQLRILRFPPLLTKLYRLLPRPKYLRYLEINLRQLVSALSLDIHAVQANDRDTLILGYLISRQKNVPLIYDSHELWRDCTIQVFFPDWMNRLMDQIERMLAGRADQVLTVSNTIADDMKDHLGIPRPVVVRNIPLFKGRHGVGGGLRQSLRLGTGTQILLYVGGWVLDRGLESLVQSLPPLPTTCHLVFLGYGPDGEALTAMANQLGVGDRVHLHPAVPSDTLVPFIQDADIGISPIPGICLSYEYCLPNKLFEYLHAGLAIVCSNRIEMTQFVQAHGVGDVYEDWGPEPLTHTLASLLGEPDRLKACKAASRYWRESISWETEQVKYLEIYGIPAPFAPSKGRRWGMIQDGNF